MPQINVIPDWKATYPADAKCQKPPILNSFGITAASWTTPNVTFTTATPHGLAVGEAFTVTGVNPSTYNGTYTTITGTTGSTVVAAAANPGTYVSGGTLTAEVPLQINLAANAVPNKHVPWQGTESIIVAPFVEGGPMEAEAQVEEEPGVELEEDSVTEDDDEPDDEEVEEEDENGHRRTVTRKRTVTRTPKRRR